MKIIINPWKSPNFGNNRDYEVDEPAFTYGDYCIYHLWGQNWLYTFKNMAINELAGRNDQHLINVAERKGNGFLYWRAIENLKKHGLEQDNKNEYQEEA